MNGQADFSELSLNRDELCVDDLLSFGEEFVVSRERRRGSRGDGVGGKVLVHSC